MSVELLLILFIGLGFPLLLYVLVRAEHGKRTKLSHDEAERVARRDIDDEQ